VWKISNQAELITHVIALSEAIRIRWLAAEPQSTAFPAGDWKRDVKRLLAEFDTNEQPCLSLPGFTGNLHRKNDIFSYSVFIQC
jgi:hypothetical protein